MCNYLCRNINKYFDVKVIVGTAECIPYSAKSKKQLQFKKDISCNCKNVLKLLTLREGFYNKTIVANARHNELAETIVCVREIYSS